MIHLITSRTSEYNEEELRENGMVIAKGKDFLMWFNTYLGDIQMDSETNVVRDVTGWVRNRKGKHGWSEPVLNEDGERTPIERECYVVQIGDRDGKDQWVFDIPGLHGKKMEAMLTALKSDRTKLIHNGLFDYVVVKWNFGIDMTNIRDTFLMSKILVTGIEPKDLPYLHNSLAGNAKRFLGIDLSKAAQTSFDGEPMNVEQIRYAAIDVAILGRIHDGLQKLVDHYSLENVVRLESSLVRPYGDAMCSNFYLDTSEWDDNIKHRHDECAGLEHDLYEFLRNEFYDDCIRERFIQKDDHYAFTWTGRTLKHQLMKLVYSHLPDDCTTLPKYRAELKAMEERIEDDSDEDTTILEMYLNKNYEDLEMYFIKKHHDDLVRLGIYTKAGTILINLNSPEQTTRLFKLIDPTIEDSGADTIKNINHPLADTYRKYSKASKLLTSYGKNFYDWLAPDGQLRVPSFNQILNTGRSSMKLYQLLPKQNWAA